MDTNDHGHLKVARLPSGVELAYEQAGEGRRVIFIHGVLGDWRVWDAQWPDFTADHACVRYSRRYNYPNPNRMPSPDHSAWTEVEDLRELMDHLGWPDAALVGSSYGAFVSLAFALRYPERCTALALSEPPMMRYAAHSEAGKLAEAEFREKAMLPARAAFERGDDELAVTIMTSGIYGGSGNAVPAVIPPAIMQARMRNALSMKMLSLSTDEYPWVGPDQLATLRMPVLLMAGAQTPAIHAEIFRNFSAAMPQARKALVADSGHATPRDNPAAFNRLLRELLAEAPLEGAHPAVR